MTDEKKSQEKPEKELAEALEEKSKEQVKEINGRGGLEPTRYDDWEIKGKCVDF